MPTNEPHKRVTVTYKIYKNGYFSGADNILLPADADPFGWALAQNAYYKRSFINGLVDELVRVELFAEVGV